MVAVVFGSGYLLSLAAPAERSAPSAAATRVDSGVAPVDPSEVAATGFDPSLIVSDNVLYDGTALTANQVQKFLDSRGVVCTGDTVCLAEYAQSTTSRAADAVCDAYRGEPDETAAEIIAKVGRACGISQAALVVLLQKEQSLVDDPAPTERSYAAATGYACPDTADCDVNYAGFYNQVYWAAWQLKRYANPPGTDDFFTWIPVGEPHDIQYNPSAECGASPVTIRSQSTAALYYYTPYQPNAQVLAGNEADPCGAFGNLNFWRIYTAWFGTPIEPAAAVGSVESARSHSGSVEVSGWALDPVSQRLPIDVSVELYLSGRQIDLATVVADTSSTGSPAQWPLASDDHGFTASLKFPVTAVFEVCASARPLPFGYSTPTEIGCSAVLGLALPDPE